MSFFPLFFLLTYSGIHYYFFCKVREAFHPPLGVLACLGVFLAFMVITPVLVHMAARHGASLATRNFAYFCYGWMGLIFLFFSASLLFELYRLSAHLIGYLSQRELLLSLPSYRLSFLFIVLISCSIFTYGIFEAGNLRVEKMVIKSGKIPPDVEKIRIVQISDLHIGIFMHDEQLKRIILRIKETEPDILISTGDMVDRRGDGLLEGSVFFQDIRPALGKFAVTGNHEFYVGLDLALDFTKKAGFTVLRDEGATVGGLINIAGFDDLAVKGSDSSRDGSFKKVLTALPPGKFTLLLYHRPLVDQASLGAFDLQLSGHTHKGQIFPFSLITRLFFPMQAGLFTLPQGSFLYVNRGAGTWGPPIRFLSPPEITIIDLVRK